MKTADQIDTLLRLLPPQSYAAGAAATQAELRHTAVLLQEAWLAAQALHREADPRLTDALLEEFEAALGVPDLCADLEMTVADRRLAVLAKLTEVGGQTPAYFEQVAHALGYPDARVVEYLGAQCSGPCTSALGGDAWRNVWSMEFGDATRLTYLDCTGPCDEPLVNWGLIEALNCVINRLKPAHTICYFHFGT